MTLRLLVTGAGGFIGRHAAAAARDAGHDVHAVTRNPARRTDGITPHTLDLLDDAAVAALIRTVRPTHVLHAAWETGHGSYWSSPANLLWVAATARLVHEFATHGGERFVMVGSSAEYDWSQGVMNESTTPTRPHTLYGACKLAAHDLVHAAAKAGHFTAATGRVFFAYGPHENAARLIPTVVTSLLRGIPAELSSGRQIRDFLHVDDVSTALLALLAAGSQGAVNIGMGEPVRLSEIAGMLGRLSGRSDLIRLGARLDRSDDVAVLVPDTKRLRDLGWAPRFTLAEGLAETYAWWRGNEGRSR